MLLPALSRLVGVISRHGGCWGNPIPINMESDRRKSLHRQAHLNWRASQFAYWQPFKHADELRECPFIVKTGRERRASKSARISPSEPCHGLTVTVSHEHSSFNKGGLSGGC